MINKSISKSSFKAGLLAVLSLVLVAGLLPLSSKALTVSPVTLELSGDPGQTVDSKMTLTNETTAPQTYKQSISQVSAAQETGDPIFTSGGEVTNWVKVSKDSVALQPGESATVDFSVDIPQTANPGGHFVAVLWSPQNDNSEKGDVSISAKVGALVFITVNGQITESGNLIEFGLNGGRKTMSHLPAVLFYRFQNSGNDRLVPQGNVVVKNWFGHTRATIDANKTDGSVLPGNIRRFNVVWNSKGAKADEHVNFFGAVGRELTDFSFGRYTATLTANYGTQGQEAGDTASFFIFPWHLMLVVLVLLLILIYIIWIAKKGSIAYGSKK